MKKSIKKVMSLILALTMCLALGVTAFADSTTIDGATSSSDKGTITISGIESGLTVNAYQIAKANYDNTGVGEFTGYEMLYTGTGFTMDEYGNCTPDDENFVESDLSALFTAAQQGGITASAVADGSGTATFTGLSVGSYLFVVTGSESTVYGMVIGSVYYETDADGNWALNNGSVDVEGDNLWVKASTPHIEKVEVGGSLTDDDWEHGGTADLGDTLTYHITVSPIPAYEGEYPEFYVKDTISKDLTITTKELNALTVTIGSTTLVKGTDYTVTGTDDGFIVNFVVSGKYTLNDYVGQSLVIEYSADVTGVGDSDVDDDDHPNTADLIYATTSYVLNGDNGYFEGTDEDIDYDYTFNVKIKKVDQNDNALGGATFTLYTNEECTEEYKQNGVTVTATSESANGHYENVLVQEAIYEYKQVCSECGAYFDTPNEVLDHQYIEHDTRGSYSSQLVCTQEAVYEDQWVSDGDNTNAGYFEFTGLEEETYYIKETTAPSGYALNTDIYKIVIVADIAEDGSLTSHTITMYSPDGEGGWDSGVNASVSNTQAVIKNVKLGTLPSMGSTGTMIFTIGGCIVVLGAAFAVVMSRRRHSRIQ